MTDGAKKPTGAPDEAPAEALRETKGRADREAATSWGYPRFAKDFPKTPEIDELVAAFARGDYAMVRERAPKVAAAADDEDVKRAARTLRERIEPDPLSRTLFLIAAVLLVFLTGWWVTHNGPEGNGQPPPKIAPK